MANVSVSSSRAPLTGWLYKRKSDNAPSRLIKSSNRRYFTLDFESKVFHYAHSEDGKTVSLPIVFESIGGVMGIGRPFCEEDGSIVQDAAVEKPSRLKAEQFGFIVRTPSKLFELTSESKAEAQVWIDGFREAMSIATAAGNKAEIDDSIHDGQSSTRPPTEQTMQTSSNSLRTSDFSPIGTRMHVLEEGTSGLDYPAEENTRRCSFWKLFGRLPKGSSRRLLQGRPSMTEAEIKNVEEEDDPFGCAEIFGQSQGDHLRFVALTSGGDNSTERLSSPTPQEFTPHQLVDGKPRETNNCLNVPLAATIVDDSTQQLGTSIPCLPGPCLPPLPHLPPPVLPIELMSSSIYKEAIASISSELVDDESHETNHALSSESIQRVGTSSPHLPRLPPLTHSLPPELTSSRIDTEVIDSGTPREIADAKSHESDNCLSQWAWVTINDSTQGLATATLELMSSSVDKGVMDSVTPRELRDDTSPEANNGLDRPFAATSCHGPSQPLQAEAPPSESESV